MRVVMLKGPITKTEKKQQQQHKSKRYRYIRG